jgi:hypothetical protein
MTRRGEFTDAGSNVRAGFRENMVCTKKAEIEVRVMPKSLKW